MPDMHAIIVADGHHGRFCRFPYAVKVSNESHDVFNRQKLLKRPLGLRLFNY